jgi:large subunit ribosomal protein L3
VTPDAALPPGTPITAAHFVAGQYVDVTGVTKGKGFAGVMKRWGFAGQGASHGNTKSHRRPGSIGGRTDPGKVWKGKKMAGRMGGERKTVKNVWVYKVRRAVGRGGRLSCSHTTAACPGRPPSARPPTCPPAHPPPSPPPPQIDTARNLVYVRGQVPGPTGSFLLLRDAFRWQWRGRAAAGLPFPTALPAAAPGDAAAAASPSDAAVTVAKRDSPDPYARYREDVGEYAEGATWKTE